MANRLKAQGIEVDENRVEGGVFTVATTVPWASYNAYWDPGLWEPNHPVASVALIVDRHYQEGETQAFDKLFQHRERVEAYLGMLSWGRGPIGSLVDADICATCPRGIFSTSPESLQPTQDWLFSTIRAFKRVFDPLLDTLLPQLYYVYTHPLGGHTSKLHKASCRVCNYGRGTGSSANDYWHGPYLTEVGARIAPKTQGPISLCSVCCQ